MAALSSFRQHGKTNCAKETRQYAFDLAQHHPSYVRARVRGRRYTQAATARGAIPIFLVRRLAYIDRTNVGFAALTMNKSLGFDASVYGLGAGIFAVGYFIFGVPSNLLLERFGSRAWLGTIMVAWAAVSASTAFVKTTPQFYCVRFLLGAAEAGLGPGLILYVTYWAPASIRARLLSIAGIASLFTAMITAPLSTWILVTLTNVGGLASWQWLFLLEAIPSVAMALIVFTAIAPKPEVAHWLDADEKAWLLSTLRAERASEGLTEQMPFGAVLRQPLVWAFSLLFFLQVIAYAGLTLWTPLIVQAHGASVATIGWALGLAYAVAAVGILLWGRNSDRTGERKWHIVLPLVVCFASVIGAGLSYSVPGVIVCLGLATWGAWASITIFWTLPAALLTGASAAGGIAFVNSFGNLGGLVSPIAIGWVKQTSGSFSGGLYFVAVTIALATALAFAIFQIWLRPQRRKAGR
jgi:ACS family tartrate transporter-like MFS transporter